MVPYLRKAWRDCVWHPEHDGGPFLGGMYPQAAQNGDAKGGGAHVADPRLEGGYGQTYPSLGSRARERQGGAPREAQNDPVEQKADHPSSGVEK